MPDQDPKSSVFTFNITPGIKRDGVIFESQEFTDGVWMRFQRGVPKKIGGYRQAFATNNGIPRGLITQSVAGTNYVVVGNSGGIDVFAAGTSSTTGTGPYSANILSTYAATKVASITSQTVFTVAGKKDTTFALGTTISFNQSGTPTFTVQAVATTGSYPTQVTTITTTSAYVGSPTMVYVVGSAITSDPYRQWQFDVLFGGGYSPAGVGQGQLQLLAHGALNLAQIDSAIAQPIYAGNILPDSSNNWFLQALSDTEGQQPTGQQVKIDGGVVAMYPFVVGYGSNGLIINNHVNQDPTNRTLNDWNGAFANSVNIDASKVIRGMPIRGGTASPSGLFWTTAALIRMSFNPGGGAGLYWNYDLLASKISVMSSNAIVQADGGFYWMGVDRFYVYNGNVQVLQNDKNRNWLFYNINYSQRQKVWATFIPAYSEIWWFYPRGTSTECNDAIIYNTQSKTWYDAGQAVGAQRSCGYTTEVFQRPIWADWNPSINITSQTATSAQPSGLPTPLANQFYVLGDQSAAFAPGNFATLSVDGSTGSVSISSSVYYFNNGTDSSTLVTTSTPLVVGGIPVLTNIYSANSAGYPAWEHESGVNRVQGAVIGSIYSSFETNDVSWVGGGVTGDSPQGADVTMRVIRVEPNFLQTGDMTLTFLGRAYASSDTQLVSQPYVFSPATTKIDVRNVDYRQLRLKFESDAIDGDYELGRMLIKVDYGSERPND